MRNTSGRSGPGVGGAARWAWAILLSFLVTRGSALPLSGDLFSGASSALDAVPGPIEAILDGVVDPESYVLGPGDQVEVLVLGDAQERVLEWIGPDGTVVMMPAGVIEIAGLSLSDATRKMVARLSPYFPGSDVTVHLRNVRRFRVRVLGEVAHPGEYLATPLTRASDVVQEAEGLVQLGPMGMRVPVAGIEFEGLTDEAIYPLDRLSESEDETVALLEPDDVGPRPMRAVGGRGSRRAVILERDGYEPRSVDLVGAVRGWPGKEDPLLLDGDRLVVPPRGAQVVIEGAVHVPGLHEFIAGENLEDAVRLAGGRTPTAASVAVVQRGQRDGTRMLVAEGDSPSIEIRLGDRVYVPESRDRARDDRVYIEGSVARPGPYPMIPGDTARDLLTLAGGWTDDALSTEAYLLRAGDKLERDAQANRIASIPDSLRSHDEWEYMIQHDARVHRAIYLDLTKLDLDEENPELTSGDVVRVPSRDNLVYVTGAVMRPGGFVWRSGATYQDYMEHAGGPTERADLGSARLLVGSTGGWSDVSRSTELHPGDTVWIPGKKRRDYWEIFQDVARTAGSIATTYLVIDRIRDDN